MQGLKDSLEAERAWEIDLALNAVLEPWLQRRYHLSRQAELFAGRTSLVRQLMQSELPERLASSMRAC